ncbi:hypothetical protein EP7_004279 [Isosphaeraceae bacterium EP7]
MDTGETEAALKRLKDQYDSLGKGGGGFDKGTDKAKQSFTELNSSLELVKKGFYGVQTVFDSLVAVINRGQGVSELSAAFGTLQSAAGSLASNELQQLRTATQGLLSDTELMRAANEALASGLKPEQFNKVAEAADALGDAFGKNTKVALDDLTRALVTGQEKLLKQYGIQIDNAKAEKEFAASIGITAKQLNEAGKLEAARIAILDEIVKKSGEVAGGTETAGDAVQRLGVSFNNTLDTISQYINEASGVVAVFDAISNAAAKAATLSEAYFGKSIQSQLFRAKENLRTLETGSSNFDISFRESEAGQKQIREVTDEIKRLEAEAGKAATETAKIKTEIDKTGNSTEALRQKYTDFGKTSEEANKKAEEAAKKLLAVQDDLRNTLTQSTSANTLKPLADQLDKAFGESFSPQNATAAFDKYITAFRSSVTTELQTKYKDQLGDATVQGMIQGITDSKVAEATYEFSKQLEEATKQAFQGTVDFFADIFTSSIDGSAQSIEQTLKDALKRVAVGFASQIAANIASSAGLTGLSNVGSAQGLGQSIAATFGFEGGGVKGLTDLFSAPGIQLTASATALDGSAAALTAAAGALAQGGLGGQLGGLAGGDGPFGGVTGSGGVTGTGFEKVAGSIGSETLPSTIFVQAGIVGAIAGAGVIAYNAIKEFDKSNKSFSDAGKAGAQTYFAGDVTGISQTAFAAYAAFGLGGNPRLAQEREGRAAGIDQILELFGQAGKQDLPKFQGINGLLTLDDKKFNIDQPKGSKEAFAVGLANPLAQIVSGGDEKLTNDFAAIFANATSDADNFNEVIANTLSLMDSLGFNAADAKKNLSDTFLDGKLSAQAFGEDLQALNILATEALVGPNSIAEAFAIIGKNIDGEGDDSPRTALKGLELEFKALAAAGFDSTEEIVGYFDSIGQSDIGDFFEKLGAIGVDSFDDIAAAIEKNPDLVYALYSALVDANGAFSDLSHTAAEAGTATARVLSNTTTQISRSTQAMRGFTQETERAARAIKQLGNANDGAASSGGSDQSLNERAAT